MHALMSMASAKVVYAGVNPNGESGTLFEGKKFWLSHNVPQRNRFKELIKNNGGVIVLQDHQADIKLVDHLRRELAPDTYSYQWVEKSIENGRLENLELYRAGRSSGTTRPVGASGVPTRRTKVPYTLEDDQILWDWLQPYEKQGAAVMGNKIYEMLEEKHPRHTFQSWRDRYLKRLRGQPRPGGPPSTAQQTTSRQEVDRRTGAEGAEVASPRRAQEKERSFARQAGASYESRRKETDASRTQNEDSESSDSQLQTVNNPTTPSRQIYRASLMHEGSTRSPQAQRSPSLHLQSPNVPDRAHRGLQAPSTASGSSNAAVSSSLTRRDPQVDTVTSRNQSILKRKRQYTDAVSENLRFDIDHRPDHKRRATDFIPKRITSIQEEPRIKIEEEENDERFVETESDETDSEERFETARQVQDTQDVLTAPPQDVDNLFMELPFPPSSPGSEDDEATEDPGEGAEDAIPDLDEWIDSRLRTGKAKNERQVIKALRCTSMDPDLADQVLSYLVAGKGIPQDMRGVWTPEDDKCLEGTDARDIDRLLKKHGTELYNRRFEYLEMVRAADYEN
ncbi:hypothetical protein VTN00DRAFT_4908 [Thermoascus crustaceus]|uniref:uncharacterized protein n=1 Tax=Thermoascus crustaceus TaxID=5088 RepID=UPI003743B48D